MKKIPSNYLFSANDLKKLIIPLIIEQFLSVAVGMIDTMMIAGIGEAAVSAISLIDTINILIINIFTALATGGAVVAGQYIGMKRENESCRAADQVVIFTTFISIIIMAAVYLLRSFILHKVFGSISDEIADYANTYLLIVSASIPFIGMYNAGAAIFRAQGNSKISMNTSLIMNIVNIAGNALLIFGFHRGIEGAAIPTLISRIIAAVIILARLRNQDLQIHISKPFSFRPDMKMIKRILRIGIPNALENSMFQLGKILTLTIVTTFGTAAITANAVSNTIAMFQILPGMSIGQAILSVVSQCVGANDYKQAHFYVKKLIKLLYASTILLNAVIIAVLPLIMKGYNLSAETAHLTRIIIYYHTICVCIIWAFSFALPHALRASNDVMFAMITSAASMWIFRIGASVVTAKILGLGVFGVWIAMTLDWFVRGVLFIIRYRVKIIPKIK